MTTRTKLIGLTVAAAALVVGVLLYNKSRMEARAKSEMLTTVPVTVATVGRQRIGDAQSLVGTIAANNDVVIVSETQGKVTGVFAEVGQSKAAGAVLFQVDDELKKANFASAETNYEKAKRDLARFEALSKEEAATDQQVEGMRLAMKAAEAQYVTARRELNDTQIKTPVAGILTSRLVDVGTYVQKGVPVAEVVDISQLKVKLNVAEKDVFRLREHERVAVTTDVHPGVTFDGTINTISSKGDEGHTYPVEVRLANSARNPLKAGMFARVAFTALSGAELPAVPREALVGSAKDPQVYVVENGVARLRRIVLDTRSGSMLGIVSGLRGGESVVVNGQNNLREGAPVTIVKHGDPQ